MTPGRRGVGVDDFAVGLGDGDDDFVLLLVEGRWGGLDDFAGLSGDGGDDLILLRRGGLDAFIALYIA